MNSTFMFSDDFLLVMLLDQLSLLMGCGYACEYFLVMLPDHVYTWTKLGLSWWVATGYDPILNIFLWLADSHIRTDTWLDLPMPMMQKSEAYFLTRIDITCGLFFWDPVMNFA
jgi:hypothetical protein